MGEVVVVRVIDLLIDELDERRQLKTPAPAGIAGKGIEAHACCVGLHRILGGTKPRYESLGRRCKGCCSLCRGYDRLFHDFNSKEEQGKSVEALCLVFQSYISSIQVKSQGKEAHASYQ